MGLGSFMKLIHYLKHIDRRDYLPLLSGKLNTSILDTDHDPELELVMMTGFARDATAARALLDRYGVQTAAELIPLLPRPRANWRLRSRRLLLNWLGLMEYKPRDR